MTRKKIERVASEAALGMKFRSDIHPSHQGEALFIEGAEWRINSVWHNNSVRPGEDCDVLVETKHRIIFNRYDTDYNELDSGTDWETEVKRWAYVSDLLPERKEKEVRDIQKSCYFRRGEPVLVRDYGGDWKIKAFTKMQDGYCKYGATTDGLDECGYRQCIPYNERTMHLLGTSEDYKEESK